MLIHVTKPGETLASIARAYTVSAARLARENGLAEGEEPVAGQSLAILYPARVHLVRQGDTTASIARRYGVSERQLWRCNPGLIQHGPQIGERLIISWRQNTLGRFETTGYAYPATKRDLLLDSLPSLRYAIPFTHEVSRSGSLSALNDSAMREAVQESKGATLLSISNLREPDGFDSEIVHAILNSEEAQHRLITETLALIRERGHCGVDVDFEYIPAADRERYPAFLRRLSAALKPEGYPVYVAVAAKNADDTTSRLTAGLDYKAIGEAVSAVLIMTYDYGYVSGPPMAVSPLPKVQETLSYAVTRIPRQKLLMGIPNYGYNWPLPFEEGKTRARSVSNEEAIALARQAGASIQYSEESQAPWFRYRENGVEREVWFEDARSLRAKLRLAARFRLRGVGFWNLSRPFRQDWTVLSALYRIE